MLNDFDSDAIRRKHKFIIEYIDVNRLFRKYLHRELQVFRSNRTQYARVILIGQALLDICPKSVRLREIGNKIITTLFSFRKYRRVQSAHAQNESLESMLFGGLVMFGSRYQLSY